MPGTKFKLGEKDQSGLGYIYIYKKKNLYPNFQQNTIRSIIKTGNDKARGGCPPKVSVQVRKTLLREANKWPSTTQKQPETQEGGYDWWNQKSSLNLQKQTLEQSSPSRIQISFCGERFCAKPSLLSTTVL